VIVAVLGEGLLATCRVDDRVAHQLEESDPTFEQLASLRSSVMRLFIGRMSPTECPRAASEARCVSTRCSCRRLRNRR
jgi:hypothetical protein